MRPSPRDTRSRSIQNHPRFLRQSQCPLQTKFLRLHRPAVAACNRAPRMALRKPLPDCIAGRIPPADWPAESRTFVPQAVALEFAESISGSLLLALFASSLALRSSRPLADRERPGPGSMSKPDFWPCYPAHPGIVRALSRWRPTFAYPQPRLARFP